MERIIITGIEDKFGKPNEKGVCTPFWACTLADGGKATIWDDKIALTAKANIGKEMEVEMKRTPAGYANIRSINLPSNEPMALGMNDTQMPNDISLEEANKKVNKMMSQQTSVPQKVAQKLMGQKDMSITAAMVVKEAAAMVRAQENWRLDTLGENLTACVTELVGAYKYAISQLE